MRLTLKVTGYAPYCGVNCVSEVDVDLIQGVPDKIVLGMIADLKNRVGKDIDAELARRGITLDEKGEWHPEVNA